MPQASSPADLEAFRAEVRDFLAQAVPDDIRAATRAHCLVTQEQARRWQHILHTRGWAAPGWPRQHGGPGWSLTQLAVYLEELAASEAPPFENLGIATIAPTLIQSATPEQCARILPRILSFEDFWSQGFSEPEAGSDLFSLRTNARREGDHYIVNGTKIWQSYGHWANWTMVLLRTDSSAGRKQEGLSMLLIDLTSCGVTVRPIRFMHGGVLHAQFFFDDVRVPVANLVGPENAGWSVTMGTLVIERLFTSRLAECKAEFATTLRLAQDRGPGATALLSQDVYARRLAELQIRTRALEGAWWPTLRAVEAGGAPILDAALLKMQGNEVLQDFHQLQLDLLGTDALAFDPEAVDGIPSAVPLVPGHANNLSMQAWRYRAITVGGGTSEVQRGIVAKAIFSGRTEIDQPLAADLNEQQAMLDDGLRRLLADRYDFDRRRTILAGGGFDEGVWRSLVELGLPGLLAPERDGGFGGTVGDLVPVFQALGESLVLEPLLWANVLPMQLLLDASGFEARGAAVDALLSGERSAFALDDGAVPLTAARSKDGWKLSGQKKLVLGADQAGRVLLSARLEGGGMALFACSTDAPGLALRRYRLHDGRGAADLAFDAVQLPATARVAGPERAEAMVAEARSLATILLCADSVGAMRRALKLTADYMLTRKQFGRALADYQALQHRMAEHYRSWIHSRTLLADAVAGWASASQSERARRISAAKWMSGRAGRAIAHDMLQLHGAVGFQDETAISHYARRLTANDALLGDSTWHLGRFIELAREQ